MKIHRIIIFKILNNLDADVNLLLSYFAVVNESLKYF